MRTIVLASLAPFLSLSFLVCPWSNYSEFLPFLLAVKKTAQWRQTPKKGGRAMERCSQTRQICFLCLSAILSCSLRFKWSAPMSQYVKIICIATSYSCAHCICVWESTDIRREWKRLLLPLRHFGQSYDLMLIVSGRQKREREAEREPLCIRRPFLPSPPMSHPLTAQL